ncbi:MAG: RNA polymerase factor sigma-54 [Alphaproteobacteria bacterium]|nr:RNA polymerase factor sigma-54 [Alphaproteobacteria bacterium]
MGMGPRLDLRQSQSLVMTPQLRQAIQLLQFNNLEAAAFVEQELERNPMLERDERDSESFGERPAPDQVVVTAPERDTADLARSDTLTDAAASPLDTAEYAEPYDPGGASDGVRGGAGGSSDFRTDERGIDDLAAGRLSLREHLSEQVRLSFHDPVDRMIGATLLALIEPTGRFSVASEAIAQTLGIEVARVEHVRGLMMRFDPMGMFAHDLKECLAVQLAEKNRLDPAMQALLDNLDLVARRDTRRLMAVCGVDAADIADMIAELRRLDPKPGANWDDGTPLTVVPDVLMRAAPDGGWLLELNPETMPRVLVNQSFTARVLPKASKEDKAFMIDKLQVANWVVKSLQQRAQTILRVSSEIVRQQDAFFRHGVSHLRPLILRDVAAAVELHESTVSRVTSNKFIATPRGTFELKYFFTTALHATGGGDSHSAEAVRHRIRQLVDAEPANEVLSDDAIVEILRREGVDIARRTVAKYRDALRIPSSVQRKREKAMPA